jgi:hydroxymethylpyrimidine/phosphomethylpyrimidine kinase
MGAPLVNGRRVVLTVAGSDSGGGAGIQADLRTFAVEGVWGTAAITAVTAQSTSGLISSSQIPPEKVADQIRAVVSGMAVAAVKTGMLASGATVDVVARELERAGGVNLVVDPVIRSTLGVSLLDEGGVAALQTRLLPLCAVFTPNIPEAEILLGGSIEGRADMVEAARELIRLGPQAVLLKGGHLRSDISPDLLLQGGDAVWLDGSRIAGGGAHGTGCVLSASIAARLALGASVEQACRHAKELVHVALMRSEKVGSGPRVLWPESR